VNSVAPGPVWTPLIPATMPEEKVKAFGSDTPLGRPGQPAELAPVYVLLASDEGSYISGARIAVTGGRPILWRPYLPEASTLPPLNHPQSGEGAQMKAVTCHGRRDVRVEDVPDPSIKEPNDAIVRVTSSGICGSDLHLYEVLGPFMGEGDILGHEPMGIVEEVGPEVHNIKPGDRVVVPFNISCGHCFMCTKGLQSQCETTQVTEHGSGAALFGYTKLYGEVPGGQAEFLRVPQAQYGPIKVPEGPPDDRFVYLSDVLPTAW